MSKPHANAHLLKDASLSALERSFLREWIAQDGPALEHEYRFATAAADRPPLPGGARPMIVPQRQWRADFAHPDSGVLIELEGGVWLATRGRQEGGRHNQGAGFLADCEKYTAAALAGWRVVRLGTGQVTPHAVAQVIEATQGRYMTFRLPSARSGKGRE